MIPQKAAALPVHDICGGLGSRHIRPQSILPQTEGLRCRGTPPERATVVCAVPSITHHRGSQRLYFPTQDAKRSAR